MKFKIGFKAEFAADTQRETEEILQHPVTPRASVVQVRFPDQGLTLAYYNDRFDLRAGDFVYVDGKLEGVLGRVVDVNCNFKIKLSDYKRVIAVADTNVKGTFFMANGHFVTFDPAALPAAKAVTWFKAPAKEEDEIVSGSDDTAFRLDDLKGMQVSPAVAERGCEYYEQNRVRYLCLDGERGYAVVVGKEAYEVEFTYRGDEIRNLTCTCFCTYNCKHEVAAMLLLRELMQHIEKHYAEQYEQTGYFAAVNKGTLFDFVVNGKEEGCFVL